MLENFKKEEISLLLKNPLFTGFTELTITKALICLDAKKTAVKKGCTIFELGKTPTSAAVILEGAVDIAHFNIDGHQILISRMIKGDLFGEALVCSSSINDFLDIRASCDSIMLYLTLPSRENGKQSVCPYYTLILQNLVYGLAGKIVMLNRKVQMLSQRTLRGKLLYLLENLSKEQKSRTVKLGCTREVLASAVSADRSAVSRELSQMRQDGLIAVHKETIELLMDT